MHLLITTFLAELINDIRRLCMHYSPVPHAFFFKSDWGKLLLVTHQKLCVDVMYMFHGIANDSI